MKPSWVQASSVLRAAPEAFAAGGRYLRTARHMQFAQLWFQALRRIKRYGAGRAVLRVVEPLPKVVWPFDARFTSPPRGLGEDGSRVLSGLLMFQNRGQDVGFPPDWDQPDLPSLWCYHLHYHDYLWDLDFDQARLLALHWIANHRVGHRRIGWDPYPTSLRLVNWCSFFFGRHRRATVQDGGFGATLWASIVEQANHLVGNLERHLLGNHLFENAVALALTGSCFDHPKARRWFTRGVRILERQLPEQILTDGGHVERSPLYHCRVLRGLLMLRNTGSASLGRLISPYLEPARGWLSRMTHPDGGVALMNDCTMVEPCGSGGSSEGKGGTFALAESGYYGERTDRGHYVICDAGPIGPDYLPGHGHADLFSFELSLNGARLVVDSGVASYEAGPMRQYCRSTRAHNTLEIDGQDQVELWSAFRVGRRCRPIDVNWETTPDGFALSARHHGYRRAPAQATHTRLFRWWGAGRLAISDRVDARRRVRCVARLHFHPDCQITAIDEREVSVRFAGGNVTIVTDGWANIAQEESYYCPALGIATPNPCLALASEDTALRATIEIGLT